MKSIDPNETRNLPFIERLKAESSGYNLLSASFIERERKKELGAAVQVAKRLGRGLTDEEVQSFNI